MASDPIVIKRFPESNTNLQRNAFLGEVRSLAEHSYRPRLVVDLSGEPLAKPDALDLLLDCVEQMENVDGRVSVAAASPETEVILEVTRLTSVVDVFPSISEAVAGAPSSHLTVVESQSQDFAA